MTHAFIRPAWTPVTIAMMIIGFMIFWPLGVAMIAYIIWGDRLDKFKSDVNTATEKASCMFSKRDHSFRAHSRTGNVAFDDWREAELKRLHEERMKLDAMRAEFDDYARELRRAKDEAEFKGFMAERAKRVDSDSGADAGEVKSAKPSKPKKVKKSGGKTVPGV
ncbi:MAG: DUF2852 domain-containing protein [Rhizobiaceae bacterium]|nr:DUF2852 domain-containing protein [Rhizobiaceae bacterium]